MFQHFAHNISLTAVALCLCFSNTASSFFLWHNLQRTALWTPVNQATKAFRSEWSSNQRQFSPIINLDPVCKNFYRWHICNYVLLFCAHTSSTSQYGDLQTYAAIIGLFKRWVAINELGAWIFNTSLWATAKMHSTYHYSAWLLVKDFWTAGQFQTWHFHSPHIRFLTNSSNLWSLHRSELSNAVMLVATVLLESESKSWGHVWNLLLSKTPYLILPHLAATSNQGTS